MPMRCKVCRSLFAPGSNAPVVLSCGHSTCRECLEFSLRHSEQLKCPRCREVHRGPDLEDLKDNYALIEDVALEEQENTGTAAQTESFSISVKNMEDKVFPVTVTRRDTFRRVKQILNTAYGFNVGEMKLLFKGQRLQDDRTVGEQNIRAGDVVQMAMTPRTDQENLITITLSTPMGKTVSATINADDMLFRFKVDTCTRYGLDPALFRLLHSGNKLLEDKTPAYYGITEGSKLDLVTTFLGGESCVCLSSCNYERLYSGSLSFGLSLYVSVCL
ncbi:uncharacterized protein LOC125034258 [Penaeus chinensis]|uniref:uncharacterized protein LOC125034258 n=1 Tax=Penaeus chinensis TaxID=139456 RepID=UPI001FB580F9|nr:uncharacterized protein LOC125034258 [Penaeus chinensis]XP_047481950.1 uncharacterized protein LOC125034258 [Penaeus chinensis]XP_047481951.1 uncharacterized protein LOC125034258 [Penaeus chinensis]